MASCDVCMDLFSELVIPKMLIECGHTFCHLCIAKILQDNKACPMCQTSLKNRTVDNYPTNYSLYKVNLKRENDLNQEQLKNLKIELTEKMNHQRHIKKIATENISKINGNLEEIDAALNGTKKIAEKFIAKVKNQLREIPEVSKKKDIPIGLSKATFNNSKEFLREVSCRFKKFDLFTHIYKYTLKSVKLYT